MRLFVGLMLAQLAIRQLQGFFPHDFSFFGFPVIFGIPGLTEGVSTWLIIVVGLICSFFIMIGLFMRVMIVPPFILMIVSAHQIYSAHALSPSGIQMLTIPFLFMGIYFFLCLVGPGKISVDYFFSLYLIHKNQQFDKEEDLEEV